MGKENFKSKIRRKKDFLRRAPKKSPYETILIVCEGEKTECNYFRDLCKFHILNTANIIVMNGEGSAPISVVDHAIEMTEKTADIDHVMCVFDCDEHSTFNQATDKIRQYKPKRNSKSKPRYHVFTSTPCFEVWLLLHFIYSTKPFLKSKNKSAADNLVSHLRQHWSDYTKNHLSLFSALNEKLESAFKNAKKLARHNEDVNSKNPATNIHELVDRLVNLKHHERSIQPLKLWSVI
ncbi:MAG: hypothetical protein A3F12_07765 [Gammaproteobacteria bacterium RIFCSPHIGHO2_12_FULL_38_14]|nr:MAG: hypothetical protein A3F12_07765 [Gammaproteobacteria bacterium RIFCSPHIGHO2_12_FULL_38_14]